MGLTNKRGAEDEDPRAILPKRSALHPRGKPRAENPARLVQPARNWVNSTHAQGRNPMRAASLYSVGISTPNGPPIGSQSARSSASQSIFPIPSRANDKVRFQNQYARFRQRDASSAILQDGIRPLLPAKASSAPKMSRSGYTYYSRLVPGPARAVAAPRSLRAPFFLRFRCRPPSDRVWALVTETRQLCPALDISRPSHYLACRVHQRSGTEEPMANVLRLRPKTLELPAD